MSADGSRVDTSATTADATTTTAAGHGRRLGHRMTCGPCQVAWTGEPSEPCWVCGQPGVAGPAPTTYPATVS